YETAEKMLRFNLSEQLSIEGQIQAHTKLFSLLIEKNSSAYYPEIKKEFEKQILQYREKGGNPFPLELQYAHFLAFKMEKEEEGLNNLEDLLKSPLRKRQEAHARMVAADILVLQ